MTISVFQVKLHLFITCIINHLKVALGNPVKYFVQGHNKQTCRLDLHTSSLMLNV